MSHGTDRRGHILAGTTWFIEGDIADCFGSLDHEVMVGILSEKIQDNRFLRLMRNILKAGCDWPAQCRLRQAVRLQIAQAIVDPR
jgi:hypothetical protein